MLVLWDTAAVVFTMQTCSTAQKKTFLHHYIIILTSVEKRDRQKSMGKRFISFAVSSSLSFINVVGNDIAFFSKDYILKNICCIEKYMLRNEERGLSGISFWFFGPKAFLLLLREKKTPGGWLTAASSFAESSEISRWNLFSLSHLPAPQTDFQSPVLQPLQSPVTQAPHKKGTKRTSQQQLQQRCT